MQWKFAFIVLYWVALFVFVPGNTKAQADSFWYESVSSSDSAIHFLIGVYHTKSEYITRNDGTGFTKMRMVIINKAAVQALRWEDYKIYILLKNGDLFYNYTTKATEGDLACKWTVQPGQNHMQYLCFDKVFDASQIDKMYLSMSDNKFFSLLRIDKQVQ